MSNAGLCSILLVLTGIARAHAAPARVVRGKKVPAKVEQVLTAIAKAAGETSIVVSSYRRSPQRQAQVMMDYYIECNRGVPRGSTKDQCGPALAKNTYHVKVHPAIDAYRANSSREANVAAMSRKLIKILKEAGSTRRFLMHVSGRGLDGPNEAVDVKPSSVSNHHAFVRAVMAHQDVDQERFFYPGKVGGVPESAFHIEIPR